MSSVHPEPVQEMARPNEERLMEEVKAPLIPTHEGPWTWEELKKQLLRPRVYIPAIVLLMVGGIALILYLGVNGSVSHGSKN
ncbi:hypothetical protein WR25_01095 [Diploscapter pachys]|uniref:Uncharacterized protein n=1 Tax=Diploscapter pachys TaxID=2018661 RepID=A0A2A2J2M0_9BILA|nr:hypothetical protein WR25_01095 [Diploscapter pachys]